MKTVVCYLYADNKCYEFIVPQWFYVSGEYVVCISRKISGTQFKFKFNYLNHTPRIFHSEAQSEILNFKTDDDVNCELIV